MSNNESLSDNFASDNDLEAFLATAASDIEARASYDQISVVAKQKIEETLDSFGYTKLEPGNERYQLELGAEIEVLLFETIERLQLPASEVYALSDDHELKSTIHDWATHRLVERAYQEEGFFTFLADDLTKFELTLQQYAPGTATYDAVVEAYSDFKRTLYAYWMIRQKLDPGNPYLRTVSALLPGPEIDPESEVMVGYIAEAISSLSEKEARDKRHLAFETHLFETLGLDDEQDPDHNIRRSVGIVVGLGSLLKVQGLVSIADREEQMRAKARDMNLPLTQTQLTTIISEFENKYQF